MAVQKVNNGNGGNGGSGASMERQWVVARLRRIADMADDARFGRGVFDLLAGYQVELRWEAHTAVARVVNSHAAYDVVVDPDMWECSCTCPDFVQRMKPCKHIVAVCLVAQAKLAEKTGWEKLADQADPQARMEEVARKWPKPQARPQPVAQPAAGPQARAASRQQPQQRRAARA